MKIIAIVYPDRRYLERLTMEMQRGLPEGYTAAGFVSIGEFASWEEHVRVKALLLYEEVPQGNPDEQRQRVISEMNGRKIPMWLLTAEKERGEEPGYVFLFQPVDQILNRLGEVTGTAPKVVAEPSHASECRCTGVIAIDGANSTAAALQLARRSSVKSKTLLLCVNPWPDGGRDWKPAESDVSELLYLLKEYGRDWHKHERFCLRAAGNVKIISGYGCFSDYGQFSDEDAEAFLSGLEGAGYESLVIDFGASPHPVLAENCEELFVVGNRSGERYATLERMFREEGLEDRLRPAEAAAVS